MSLVRRALDGLRTHVRVVAAVGSAVVVLGGGIGMAVASDQPVSSAPIVAHQTHSNVSGPSLEDPSAYSPTTPQDGVGHQGVASTTTTVAAKGIAASGNTTQTSVVVGRSVTNAQTVTGAPDDGFSYPKENPSTMTAVTTALPSTLVMPPGAVWAGNAAVQFPNGVVEWKYLMKGASHTDVVKVMRTALSSNGWSISSESDGPPITLPDGTPMRTKGFYVTSAGYRGLVNVNGPTTGDITIQIDLVTR